MSTRGIAVLSGSNTVVAKILEDGTISFGQDKQVTINVSGNLNVTGTISTVSIISSDGSITNLSSSFITSSNIISTTITASIIKAQYFTGSHADVDFVDFNGFNGEAPYQAGRLYYNTASNLLSVYTEYPNTHIHIGQQLVAKVQNDLGITLAKGKVVYITGSTSSDVPRVVTASWENDTYSARTLGLVMADILPGARGYAILEGLLEGLDTDNFLPGQLVYLSSSGNITNIQPPAPFHEVRLGEVIRKQNNNGSIFVRIQNGYELSELHDVEIPNPQNGDILTYSTASFNQWVNSKTLNGFCTITNSLTASNIFYSASNPEYWSGTAPNTIREAINRLAAAVHNLLTGTIP